jgi:hypothetical protein
MSTERKFREEIVRYGRMLHERGIRGGDGWESFGSSEGRPHPGDADVCEQGRECGPGDMVIVDL